MKCTCTYPKLIKLGFKPNQITHAKKYKGANTSKKDKAD